MIPMIFILALYLEPVGSTTDEPWDFVQELEYVDPKSFEDIEREIDEEHPIEALRNG